MKEVEVTEFEVLGHYRFSLPKEWRYDAAADDVLSQFYRGDHKNGVIVLRAVQVRWPDITSAEPLMVAMKRFINSQIVDLVPELVEDMQTRTAIDGKNNVAETLIRLTIHTGWIIRMVYAVEKKTLYCLYFNGQFDDVVSLQPFFDLFEILPRGVGAE